MKKINKRKTMKGGEFSATLFNLSNSISQGASALSQKASNLWKQTKDKFTGSSNVSSTSSSNYVVGGRTRKRRIKGGFTNNTYLSGISSNASLFSGPIAQSNNLIGGKNKRRGKKSRKH